MAKVRVTDTEIIWCCPAPGCHEHRVPIGRWTLSGTVDNPTITPSLKETTNPSDHKDYRPDVATSICHCIITNGQIKFCDDCTHNLAGQTLPLEDISS